MIHPSRTASKNTLIFFLLSPLYTYDTVSMNDIKEHAEFEGLDWEALESKHVAAPWVPEGPAPHPEPDSIASAHDIYRGDQVQESQPVQCCGVCPCLMKARQFR